MGFLVPGVVHNAWPVDTCQWTSLSACVLANVVFNIVILWATLTISPLVARLSILIGFPLGLVIDALQSVKILAWRVVGVTVVLVGVATFQAAQPQLESHHEENLDAHPNCDEPA